MTTAYAAALSRHPDPAVAVAETVGHVLDRLGPAPELAVLFCSGELVPHVEDIVATIQATLGPGALIGTTGEAVLGGAQEIEEGPALSLWAASGLGAVEAVHLRAVRHDDAIAVVGLDPAPGTLLLLADPFTFPADGFVRSLDGWSGLTVVGGMASAAQRPGGNRIVVGGEVHDHGGAAVLLPEGAVTTIVSQGCRPIGNPYVVTGADQNRLVELAGRPALVRLQETVTELAEDDRALVQQGLHIGLVVDEHQLDFARGDFLIRGVIGLDRTRGEVAIGQPAEVGTTVQFQVRDAATADEDLRLLLRRAQGAAALVFTCNGRGTRLFDEPHHDAGLVASTIHNGALAGMSCAGEIGPVGGRSFVHGFTASIALFR